ncbi:MAG: ATP-binding protein [Planctomycetes bacterium]|nr:ATP-binding protein [Planctomycetota bacterium]
MTVTRKVAELSALERLAWQAIRDGNYQDAALQTVAAAALCYDLAEAERDSQYALDGTDLVAIAEELTSMAEPPKSQTPGTPISADEPAPLPIAELPKLRLDDVAGMDDVKAAFHEKVLRPLRHPEIYERFQSELGGGVLLYGPPGTGKTFIAKALAGELGVPFYCPELSGIKSKYVGETAKNMTRLFEEARKHPLSVIFMDEVDSLLANRGHRHADAVAQFLTLADGMQNGDGKLLLVGATNRPWSIDSAVLRPGRLGTHVYVGLPDPKARVAMLEGMLREVPCDPALPRTLLAEQCAGRTGAEIKEIVTRAKARAIERQIATHMEQQVGEADFAHALAQVPPGTSAEELQKFEEWRTRRHNPDQDQGED